MGTSHTNSGPRRTGALHAAPAARAGGRQPAAAGARLAGPRSGRPRGAVAAAAGAHICVVGGGVAGLTTALRVLLELPDACVTVVAEAWGTDITSAGAAGKAGPLPSQHPGRLPGKGRRRWLGPALLAARLPLKVGRGAALRRRPCSLEPRLLLLQAAVEQTDGGKVALP
jgi:hypothetical protein